MYYVCVRRLEHRDERAALRRSVHRGLCLEGGIEISIVLGLTLVALFVVAAVGGVILVQHLVPSVQRSQHIDVAGFIYAVLSVAYAVLLGLMVVAVWQSWEAADSNATEGANELAAIFWLAHGLPESEGRHIQELARSYAREVVDDEWQTMARREESPKAWAILDEMRGSIQALEPDTASLKLLYDHTLQLLHELADARQERLLQANAGLPAILWAVPLIAA